MEFYSIGLMSGTSMDGIDAALMKTDGVSVIEPIEFVSSHYDPEVKTLLKATEFAIRQHDGSTSFTQERFVDNIKKYLQTSLQLSIDEAVLTLKKLSHYLQSDITYEAVVQLSTRLHGDVVEQLLAQTKLEPKKIDVIGYHGQTLFHSPEKGISLQIGDGQALANRLGIAVVNDFRIDDIKAGGQGAPLAPMYHQALAVRDKKYPIAVLNCGGIANVTFIWGDSENDLVGFDTGPGNGLIDRYIKMKTKGEETMDEDGRYGSKGIVNPDVLKALYAKAIHLKSGKNYLELKPPKSLDINDLILIPELDTLSLEDACATLEAFTAQTIAESLHYFDQTKWPHLWVLAGGGWHNPVIRGVLEKQIKTLIKDAVVEMAEDAGWNSQFMEAEIFAYLAVRRLLGLPISVPATTGVSKPLSGGHLYIPSQGASEAVAGLLAHQQ